MTAVMMDDDFMVDSDAEMSAIDESFSDYDDDDENVALPSVKKGSKPAAAAGGAKGKGKANAGAKKNAASNNNAGKKKGLAQRNTNMIDEGNDDDEDGVMVVKPSSSSSSNKKTVEERYQKMEQQEHILKRPDTYIGSTSPSEDEEMFIYDSNEDAIIKKKITYTPGLFKIFDESKFLFRL